MATELEQLLVKAKLERARGVERSELWSQMHDLAEAHYEPAIAWFRSFLDDPDWDWRLEGIELLGFHYLFPPESETLEKLRHLVLADPNDFVRVSAAMAMGSQLARVPKSAWPDRTLVEAIQHDPEASVRAAVFESLLRTAGLPFPALTAEIQRVEQTRTIPSMDEVRRILRENGIDAESSP